jgi:hypothetical protein
VDYYLRARREFVLAAKPAFARLRVTAFTRYALYVNGKYVGSGPAPGKPTAPRLDEYAAAELPLVRGRNVMAVLAHNLFVGTARDARAAGGLWLQLDVEYPDGATETIATDREWRVARAEDFHRRAPRVYWTTGFTEVRDLRREPVGWKQVRFKDRRWAPADEVKPELPEGAGPIRLRPILMTTFAMIFGMLPVALFGSESRAPMAVTVIGGLTTSTILTLVVVPVVYTLLDDLVHPSRWRVVQWLRRPRPAMVSAQTPG